MIVWVMEIGVNSTAFEIFNFGGTNHKRLSLIKHRGARLRTSVFVLSSGGIMLFCKNNLMPLVSTSFLCCSMIVWNLSCWRISRISFCAFLLR